VPQLAGGLLVAVGADEQDPLAGQLPGGELAQGQRIRVGPVQVLDHDKHRPGIGEGSQEPGRCLEEPEPGAVGGGTGKAGGLRGGRRGPAKRLDRFGRPDSRVCRGAHNLRPWPERRHPMVSEHRPHSTGAPWAAARSAASTATAVLPIPASPPISTRWPRPAAAWSYEACRIARTSSRPISPPVVLTCSLSTGGRPGS
jgi:hypothetical protein